MGQRIGYAELVTEMLDERPEAVHRGPERAAVLTHVARLDELPPGHKMRAGSSRAQYRCIGTAAPLPTLEPVVQGRARYAEHFRGEGLVVELAVKNGGCHDAHHASLVCP
jgi:hypothetical protein